MKERKSVMFALDEHTQLKVAAAQAGESIRHFVMSRLFGERQMEPYETVPTDRTATEPTVRRLTPDRLKERPKDYSKLLKPSQKGKK
jgi:hypothetical protein